MPLRSGARPAALYSTSHGKRIPSFPFGLRTPSCHPSVPTSAQVRLAIPLFQRRGRRLPGFFSLGNSPTWQGPPKKIRLKVSSGGGRVEHPETKHWVNSSIGSYHGVACPKRKLLARLLTADRLPKRNASGRVEFPRQSLLR